MSKIIPITATSPRYGDWIQVASGKPFWPLDPTPEDIEPQDIAHALSQLCRFGGHCLRFASVAEHSVYVSRAVSPEHALWGLLHDASEAYLVDIPRPIKRFLPDYARWEEALLAAVAARFFLPWPMPAQVKEMDDRVLRTEQAQIMAPCARSWALACEPLPGLVIACLPPQEAERLFLARLADLWEGD